MARFDVYANPDSAERRFTPFFLDVQNDYISGLETRVVIPLPVSYTHLTLPTSDLV